MRDAKETRKQEKITLVCKETDLDKQEYKKFMHFQERIQTLSP